MLYDPEKDEFTRGQHQGESLVAVAMDDPSYIMFLATSSNTDEDTVLEMQDYIESYPELFQDVKVWKPTGWRY